MCKPCLAMFYLHTGSDAGMFYNKLCASMCKPCLAMSYLHTGSDADMFRFGPTWELCVTCTPCLAMFATLLHVLSLSHSRQVPARSFSRKDNAPEFSSAGFDVLSQSVFVLNIGLLFWFDVFLAFSDHASSFTLIQFFTCC